MSGAHVIGIDWGSTNLSAQLIGSDGTSLDRFTAPLGVTKLDRAGMAAAMDDIAARWPQASDIFVSGMIGSSVGWLEVPYCECPSDVAELARRLTAVEIGVAACRIVPGLACETRLGTPDVMRGEELEIFGFLQANPQAADGETIVVLPGTHTKWARLADGRVADFFTSMTGEIFDRLSERGLLSSILTAQARPGPSFSRGVELGMTMGAGLTRLLFGVRALVVRRRLELAEAASYARGLLIGAEIADALVQYSQVRAQTEIPLLGNSALCQLYAEALRSIGLAACIADKASSTAQGYAALHRLCLKTAR